jgi:adenylate cyclase
MFDRSDMLILKAEGDLPDQQATWEIEHDRPLLLGRSKENDCSVPWDARVSRKHARVALKGEHLSVCCLPNVSNLIWKSGSTCVETLLAVGESFRIGQTRFVVSEPKKQAVVVEIVDEAPSTGSHTSSIMLNAADVRLALVSSNAASLWTATTDKVLAQKSLDILQQVLTFADVFIVLSYSAEDFTKRLDVIHWHVNRKSAQPSVSRDLVARAATNGNTAVLLDVDENGAAARSGRWSFCVPVQSDAATPWCIYIDGAFGPTADYGPFLTAEKLKSDVVVTELVSHLAGAVRSVRSMENKFEGVRQFFSPQLLEKISDVGSGASSMAPRETNITALYCDLRGFSRMVSRSSGDLHGLLRKISEALGAMTSTIIAHQGVIADFQGDSALGFWGWPLAMTDGPLPACRAALQIRHFFDQANKKSNGALKGFHVGIGIATGRAIAGRIGTRDHAKIGVFGPVVNIASRLEGLTKKTGAAILMDSATSKAAVKGLYADEGRCRPLGKMLPTGFDDAVEVSELLQPASSSPISDTDIDTFASALKAFRTGKWDECRQLLARLPADDRPRDFLLVQIASNNYQPPLGWSGVIHMDSK